MNILPVDVAEEMKECALSAGHSTANERFGTQQEADVQKIHWNEHAENFKKHSVGLLSAETCDDIKSMFWFQAWRTANERKGYDYQSDIKTVDKKFQSILNRGDMSHELASSVKGMGWYVAWYCANKLYGYDDDAKTDKARYEQIYNTMYGDVNLVAMNFNMDKAKITQDGKPKVIAEQNLVNNSDIEQEAQFSFTVTEGKTISVSNQIAFKYGVKVGFKAGFFNFGKSEYEVSFEFSHNHTFSESINTGITKNYTFRLKVPPHMKYNAKGMVHECEMEIPYELVFDFGGTRKSLSGIWKGVAVSIATYEVNPV